MIPKPILFNGIDSIVALRVFFALFNSIAEKSCAKAFDKSSNIPSLIEIIFSQKLTYAKILIFCFTW